MRLATASTWLCSMITAISIQGFCLSVEPVSLITRKFCHNEYKFIDSGDCMRLESFSDRIICRSCLSATWPRTQQLSGLWNKADIVYKGTSGVKGTWSSKVPLRDGWVVAIDGIGTFNLQLSTHGQLGIFPEQRANWLWIKNVLLKYHNANPHKQIKILNGFAYTGGATMSCLSANANVEVTHLDSAKSYITVANQNIQNSYGNFSQTRFVAEDCMTFLDREIRRENKYDALIFDPPAFGRSESKTWRINRDFDNLLSKLPLLLSEDPAFVLISCHDENWPLQKLITLVDKYLSRGKTSGGDLELLSCSEFKGNKLPLGVYARWTPHKP